MDIGKSISFVFEDKQWLPKVLIGGLVLFGTILLSWTVVGLFVGMGLLMGYSLDLLKNVRRGDPQPLPEWDDWGDKIVKGLKLFVVLFVWSLPLIVISLPSVLLSALADSSSDVATFLTIVTLCFSCFQILFGIALALFTPAIFIKFAENESIADGFAFSEIFRFTREHLGEIIIALLVAWAVQMVAGLVGTILCVVGLLFTGFWSMLVQAHLYAQIGRDSQAIDLGSDRPYDIYPEDVMPGVGELMEETEAAAHDAVTEVQDLGDAVNEAGAGAVVEVQDLGDSVKETGEEAADDIFENLPDDSKPPA